MACSKVCRCWCDELEAPGVGEAAAPTVTVSGMPAQYEQRKQHWMRSSQSWHIGRLQVYCIRGDVAVPSPKVLKPSQKLVPGAPHQSQGLCL